MLGKLFRHEWKSISRMLLPVHGFLLLFAVFSRIFFEIQGGFDNASDDNSIAGIITLLIVTALIIILCGLGIFTYIYIGRRFYKNVFGDQGYLTNTLPVTPTQIILSKGLAGYLWMVLDAAVVIISCCILILSQNTITGFITVVSTLTSELNLTFTGIPVFLWIVVICLLLMPFLLLAMLFLSIAIGNLLSSHKVIGAIGAYIGLYIIMQVIGSVESRILDTFQTVETVAVDVFSALNLLNPYLLINMLLLIVYTALMFLGTRYILAKRLNLQ